MRHTMPYLVVLERVTNPPLPASAHIANDVIQPDQPQALGERLIGGVPGWQISPEQTAPAHQVRAVVAAALG